MNGLQVIHLTPLCQLQDLGRRGWQVQGVTRSGAMDRFNLRVANALVGNHLGTACLEFALTGGEFKVSAHSLRIAFAGEFELTINGAAQPCFVSHRLCRGDVLTVGTPRRGVRGYLAVAGGFACKPELGSCSTHSRSGIGGFGDRLRAGGELPTQLNAVAHGLERSLRPALRRPLSREIRVVRGPQDEHFTAMGLQTFFKSQYTVAQDSDRMGLRLEGPSIEHAGDGNIISDPVLPGSIQVPAAGQPIVLMADGPTTGGYPKIATVASVDLAALAQLAPGDPLQFIEISVADAQSLLIAEESFFSSIEMRLDRF